MRSRRSWVPDVFLWILRGGRGQVRKSKDMGHELTQRGTAALGDQPTKRSKRCRFVITRRGPWPRGNRMSGLSLEVKRGTMVSWDRETFIMYRSHGKDG